MPQNHLYFQMIKKEEAQELIRKFRLDLTVFCLVMLLISNLTLRAQTTTSPTGSIQDHILMSATHTHSCIGAGGGPEGDGLGWCSWDYGKPLVGYQNFLVSRIVDGVQISSVFTMRAKEVFIKYKT